MRGLRCTLPTLAIALIAAGLAPGQPPAQPTGTTVRGFVVRVDPASNLFIMRTGEGKEVTLFSGQRSTFRFNDRTVRLQDLREGMPVTAVYAPAGDRFVVSSVMLSAAQEAREGQAAPAAGEAVRGRIVGAHAEPPHLVIRSEDGKEVILYLDGRQDATFRYEMRGGKRMLTALSTGQPAAAAPSTGTAVPRATELTGTGVRVAGSDNPFIVRTEDGREVTVYADPKAVYEFDGRAAQFSDLRSGVGVSITYDVRDRRHYARRIIGRPRR
jgi:hypothetical protein